MTFPKAAAALAAAALAGAAAPARADVGVPIDFPGFAMKQKVQLPPLARSGDVVWESGESRPVSTRFDALLFQGLASRPGLRFEAAVKDGPAWGPWVEAEGERFPRGRFWYRVPAPGDRGATVRLRAVFDGTGGAGWVEFFGLYASGSDGEHSRPVGSSPFRPEQIPPAGTAPSPAVEPRGAWAAASALKPYEPMIPDRISVHHTEAGRPMSRAAAIQELQAIQRFHQRGRGWIDIAYHFLIDGTGQIWEGRPLGVVGAHVRDKNDGNVGISVMGDFQPPKSERPTAAQLRSLVLLARWLSTAYGIAPSRIQGHRDQEATTCPGDILYAELDSVRRAVGSPAPPVVTVSIPDAAPPELPRFRVLETPARDGVPAIP